jgi:flagellar basal body-associated protein FliL
MAKEAPAAEKAPAAAPGSEGGKAPFLSKKMLMIGIPLFIVQLVAIVVILKMFVFTSGPSTAASHGATKTEESAKGEEGGHGAEGAVQNIFVVKDVIVNPAGTNGTRFLLTTVGFEVSSPEAQKELEAREVQVRDVLNSVLTSKGLDELVDPAQREALRNEISERVGANLRNGSLTSVYFSKFIIQ